MTAAASSWESTNPAESSLLAKMAIALGHQAQVEDVAIHLVTGVVDVAVALPPDLAGPELDMRYAWVRWNLESLIARGPGTRGLRLGQVHTV
jgi:hypothetical protein